MSINVQLASEVRDKLIEELPERYAYLITEYDSFIAKPNYRAAFMVLMKVLKIKKWKPSEQLNAMIGRFWHELAE